MHCPLESHWLVPPWLQSSQDKSRTVDFRAWSIALVSWHWQVDSNWGRLDWISSRILGRISSWQIVHVVPKHNKFYLFFGDTLSFWNEILTFSFFLAGEEVSMKRTESQSNKASFRLNWGGPFVRVPYLYYLVNLINYMDFMCTFYAFLFCRMGNNWFGTFSSLEVQQW